MLLAHKMAMESEQILAEAIEATEFPDLARKYRVMAVPRIIINERAVIEGAMPEAMFVEQVLAAARESARMEDGG